MQLIYRGQAYTYSSNPATLDGELVGKYRGVVLRRSAATGIFLTNPPATLTYRGISYENQ